MPVILRSDAEQKEWLQAPAAEIEAIQSRVLATYSLEIVSPDEAAQYVGSYIKRLHGRSRYQSHNAHYDDCNNQAATQRLDRYGQWGLAEMSVAS